MLFSTIQEINHIIPTSKFAKLDNLISRLNAEEMSSLYPLVGMSLLQKLNEDYASISENKANLWSNESRSAEDNTKVIILRTAQEILLYSYLANHSAILQSSFNMGGGWNSPSTADFDALDNKGNDRLDKDLWHSARRSKENLLLYLEMDARNGKVYTELWQQSDYYYQHQDLLFTTPSELHPQYINLGDTPHLNFQAYISILHDCQDGYIAGTIGYPLLQALISRKYNAPVPTHPNSETPTPEASSTSPAGDGSPATTENAPASPAGDGSPDTTESAPTSPAGDGSPVTTIPSDSVADPSDISPTEKARLWLILDRHIRTSLANFAAYEQSGAKHEHLRNRGQSQLSIATHFIQEHYEVFSPFIQEGTPIYIPPKSPDKPSANPRCAERHDKVTPGRFPPPHRGTVFSLLH